MSHDTFSASTGPLSGLRVIELGQLIAGPFAAKTLADFGVSSYFGVQTFTAGIYKAWLVMDNRWAAAQLSTALLVLVGLIPVILLSRTLRQPAS